MGGRGEGGEREGLPVSTSTTALLVSGGLVSTVGTVTGSMLLFLAGTREIGLAFKEAERAKSAR